MTVPCYCCSCPVDFDPTSKLEAVGISLADLSRRNLYVICALCSDMLDVEGKYKQEVKDLEWLKGILHSA